MNAELAVSVVAVGVGATLMVDAWALVRRGLLGQPLPNWAFVGRWFANVARGRFHHRAIAAAKPVAGESAIGWSSHYLTGIAFAALLPVVNGASWFAAPTPLSALAVGVATVAAPFFILQPGMGAGIAGSRTPRPAATRLQSLMTHAVFGLGLYFAALVLSATRGV